MIADVRLSKDYGFTSDSAGKELETLLGATEGRRREARPLSIDCSGIAISRNSLLAFARALESNAPPIVSLNLNCTSLGPQGTRMLALALRQNVSLRQLRISGCHCGDEGLAALAKVVSSGGAAALASIELDKCIVEDRCAIRYKRKPGVTLAKKSKRRRRRRTKPRFLEDECAVIAAVGLGGRCRHRDDPNFCFDMLQGEPVKAQGCTAIARSLHNNSALFLHNLILRNCFIGDKGARILARGLAHYSYLDVLDLSGTTRIRESGTVQLTKALATIVSPPFKLIYGTDRWDSFDRVPPSSSKERDLFLAAVIRHGCSRTSPSALELSLPQDLSTMALLCRLLRLTFHGGGRTELFLTLPAHQKEESCSTLAEALTLCQYVRNLHIYGGCEESRSCIRDAFLAGPCLRPPKALISSILLVSIKHRLPPELVQIVFDYAWDGKKSIRMHSLE